LIESGYLWNSGNFVFCADVTLEELGRFEPEVAAAASRAVALAGNDLSFIVLDSEYFAKAQKISIDFAVMEPTQRATVLALDVGWSDVGHWSAATSARMTSYTWRTSTIASDAWGRPERARPQSCGFRLQVYSCEAARAIS
jgi:mannose-1-phosphate guanylyltransferase